MRDGLSNFPGAIGWPGEPPTEPIRAWVLYDDGALGQITVTGGQLPELARPGRLITAEEYNRLTVTMADAHAARLEGLQAADTARQEREYEDLVQAGIPEETARRLSGYTGPAVEVS